MLQHYLLYKLKLEAERKFLASSKTCHVRFLLLRKFHIYFTLSHTLPFSLSLSLTLSLIYFSLTHARCLIPPLHLISLLSSPPHLLVIKAVGLSTSFTKLMPEIQIFLSFSVSSPHLSIKSNVFSFPSLLSSFDASDSLSLFHLNCSLSCLAVTIRRT